MNKFENFNRCFTETKKEHFGNRNTMPHFDIEESKTFCITNGKITSETSNYTLKFADYGYDFGSSSDLGARELMLELIDYIEKESNEYESKNDDYLSFHGEYDSNNDKCDGYNFEYFYETSNNIENYIKENNKDLYNRLIRAKIINGKEVE